MLLQFKFIDSDSIECCKKDVLSLLSKLLLTIWSDLYSFCTKRVSLDASDFNSLIAIPLITARSMISLLSSASDYLVPVQTLIPVLTALKFQIVNLNY